MVGLTSHRNLLNLADRRVTSSKGGSSFGKGGGDFKDETRGLAAGNWIQPALESPAWLKREYEMKKDEERNKRGEAKG